MTNRAKVTRTAVVALEFAGYEVAQMFWDLDCDYQAQFFEEIARLAKGRLPFQLEHVKDSPYLMDGGRYVMQTIGKYGDK